LRYIEKYYQGFMNESQKKEYSVLKNQRKNILKEDPGEWDGDICSFTMAKKYNPNLYEWYCKKSKIQYALSAVDDKIKDLEENVMECMEEKICNPGNCLVYRKPPTKYTSKLMYLVLEKSGRDNYYLFNLTTQKDKVKRHWKSIIKEFKQSEISE